MHRNKKAFCCNPNNLVFLCKTRSLTMLHFPKTSAQLRYTLLYMEFRHLTVFALYRMEIYPAQPMSGSPFRQRQRFRNGEQLEISCKTVFCQPPRFRAACNKSKSELPEFNSAEFGLIFLSAGEWIIPAYSSCGIIQRIVGKYDSKAPSS